jgi:hypothetical protein
MPSASSHSGIVRGRAGTNQLRQHDVRAFDEGRTLVLASAFAMPRLWGYALDAAFEGFAEGLGRSHDGSVTSRLHHALEESRKRLRTRVEALLERKPPDVGLIALSADDACLHVLCCGPGRVYVRHGQRMRRLAPREDRAEGLLKATPAWCVEAIEAGDLVIAGSISACGEASLTALREHLSHDMALDPEAIVQTLNADAAARQIGSAALAFHIERRLTVT